MLVGTIRFHATATKTIVEREVPLSVVTEAVIRGRESGFIFKAGEVGGAEGDNGDDWMDRHLADRFGPMPGLSPGEGADDLAGAPMPRGPPVSAYSEEGGFVEMAPEDLHSHCAGESCDWESGSLVVVDIRSPSEYAGGHIPGALSLPFDELSDLVRAGRLDDFRRGGRVVVCCAAGQRSAQATVRLSQVFDFDDVVRIAYNLTLVYYFVVVVALGLIRSMCRLGTACDLLA